MNISRLMLGSAYCLRNSSLSRIHLQTVGIDWHAASLHTERMDSPQASLVQISSAISV